MHIEKLRMQNFRGFKDVTIDFPSNLAVFIGVNGSGKSSIIDCLDNLLFELILSLIPIRRNSKTSDSYSLGSFNENDISIGHQETINELQLEFLEFKKEFSRDINILHCFSYSSISNECFQNEEKSNLTDV
ncbi:MAG: AAA family ATPase, partial [Pseudanabaena sp.]